MRRLWIAVCHPAMLVEALQSAQALRKRFDSIHFIYENHRAWGRIRLEEFAAEFATFTPIQAAKLPHGVFGVWSTWQAIQRQIQEIDALKISSFDCVLFFSALTLFANTLLSRTQHARRVLAISRKKYLDFNQEPDMTLYRNTTAGWLCTRFLLPAAGLQPTLNLRLRTRGGGDGERLRRFPQPLSAYFQAILVTDNPGAAPMSGLPPHVQQTVFPDAHFLTSPKRVEGGERLTVFFGTPFLALRNIPIPEYVTHLNACLDFLRKFYGSTSRIVYRPHPAETEETQHLAMDQIEVQNDREPAELFFLRQTHNLDAVFSVSSTVSRNALLLGLPSYALWKVFPFEERARDYFASVMGDVPKGFYIESLSQQPERYALPYDPSTRNTLFIQTLERAAG